MSAIIQISRDSESFRIELQDEGDASILQKLGPYSMIQEGDCILCQPDPSGTYILKIDERFWGFRFLDDVSKGWTRSADLKYGRFGPIEFEVDIYNSDGFEITLPLLFERPWPTLRENKSYDIGEQIMITLAERINDMIDFSGMPRGDVMILQCHKVPDRLRRHMPYGCGEAMIKEYMARLRLPSAS